MGSRRFGLVVLAVAVSFAWAGCEPAPQPSEEKEKVRPAGRNEGRPVIKSVKEDDDSIRVRLLSLEAVQTDLGLTADQAQKLRDFIKTGDALGRARFAEMKDRTAKLQSQRVSPGESEARQRELRAWFAKLKGEEKEFRTKVLAILTPSQSERLKQIQLQDAVPAALGRPEIVKALDLSKEQRERIRVICDRVEEKQRAAWPDLRDLNRKERRQKMIEYMEESHKAYAEAKKPILDVLTREQRAKFESLLGKKIEVTWPFDQMIPEDAEY